MDEDNLQSWASQPDVCRCCLSTSGTWDLTASYITDVGLKEIYSDILRECYGIQLSYLSEWGPSHLICDLCVGHLRDVNSFKKQVLKAEDLFVSYYNCRKASNEVKLELQEDQYNQFSESEQHGDDGKNDDNIESKINSDTLQCKKEVSKSIQKDNSSRKGAKITKSKKRKRRKDVACDPGVPTTDLSNQIESLDFNRSYDDNIENGDLKLKENESKDLGNNIENTITGLQLKTCAKQLSETKRVMMTCETVLKDTTACPFRHRKSWFQCFYCTQEFMDIITLKTHISELHKDVETELRKIKRYPRTLQIDISDLDCRLCRENLTDVQSMRRHFEICHNKVIYQDCIADYKVNSSPYSCHLCTQEFHVFRTLTTHLNEHYANCICDVCGRSFINIKRLKVHKRNHEKGQFPCSECGKILKTKTSKANHIESAHSKRIIKCQICFKPMKHYNDRIKHMSEAHNITHMFKCNICFKEYKIKHYLATHMRQTHGNKNKKCLECGMAFITNHGLKKHMSKHTGIKPHKCLVCGKSYARSYTLREHMRSHETDRGFLSNE